MSALRVVTMSSAIMVVAIIVTMPFLPTNGYWPTVWVSTMAALIVLFPVAGMLLISERHYRYFIGKLAFIVLGVGCLLLCGCVAGQDQYHLILAYWARSKRSS